MGDEQDVSDPTVQAGLKSAMATFHVNRPKVITFTNQLAGMLSDTGLRAYMQAVQPDMLCFDMYPFDGNVDGGSPTVYYNYMQRYRIAGLAGNDGTGAQSIPVGYWTQAINPNHIVSESEIRLNNFSGWAFGCKFSSAFLYQGGILFTGEDTDNATAQFHQVAETNRQSLNLGPALVRLISTDVRMLMGKHTARNWLGQEYGKTNTRPDGVSEWNSGSVPYVTDIAATNLGVTNDGRTGDVIVGVLKPLDGSFTNEGHADDAYFMLVNGLSDAAGTAAECRQRIHLDFDFGDSGITSLLRLSRGTGRVEEVPLLHGTGSQYSLDLCLDGGTGDLFKFNNGGTFVPEPTCLVLLVTGGIGMSFAYRRHILRRAANGGNLLSFMPPADCRETTAADARSRP